MNGHHLILGDLDDLITGERIKDTLDERYRQKIAQLLINQKGYLKTDITPRRQMMVTAGDCKAILKMDFVINIAGRIGMIIKFGPGSIVTRRRPVLAASRIIAPYQIPLAVVTNGEDAEIIDGSSIRRDDSLIGIPSSGVHSNGFSLIRKIFGEKASQLNKEYDGIEGPIGDELLKPTAIYVDIIKKINQKYGIKGIAHITGGGFTENIPRMLPTGLKAVVYKGAWPMLPIFDVIQREGGISEESMYGIFNMGIGLVLCVDRAYSDKIAKEFNGYVIGQVWDGEGIEIK